MFRIQPGELNKQVIVEQKSTSRGTIGEVVESWSTLRTVWCKVLHVSGKESETARRETGRIETRFWCRHFTGLTMAMRLNLGGRYFDIVDFNNVEERGVWLEIVGVETR